MASHNIDHLRLPHRSRLRTNRGITATIATAFFVLTGTAGSRNPGGSLLALIIFSPAIWWFSWWAVGVVMRAGESLIRGQVPDVRVGRQWQSGGSSRQQVREDSNARVFSDRGGILLRKRRWFVASGTPPFEISEARWREIAETQCAHPQYMGSFRDRRFWRHGEAFYWTNADYSAEDIKALLFARQRQRERELEHAHALLAASTSPAQRKREPVPRDVRRAVWERDEGHCVECGSDFDIQYDHIIPFSMGGATTVENMQLLCARCNQVKGARL